MSYKISWEERGVKCIYSGSLTGDDLVESNIEMNSDSRSSAIDYLICNFIEVNEFPIRSEGVRRTANLDKKRAEKNPDVKLAVVANRPVIKGLTNMYVAFTDDSSWETAFFEDESEARNWIGECASIENIQ